MYPNEDSYMPNDSMNIEKHIKNYLRNTCLFNVNRVNQGSPIFSFLSWTSVLQKGPSPCFERVFNPEVGSGVSHSRASLSRRVMSQIRRSVLYAVALVAQGNSQKRSVKRDIAFVFI
jgi:hypothetical protein